MRIRLIFLLFIPIIFQTDFSYAFEPITATAGAAVLGIIGYFYNTREPNCDNHECCDDRSIPGDTHALERELQSKLYGQHIVIQMVIPALKAHFSKRISSKKALVLSFHGTPGTGKNFVADLIAKSLYKKGLMSEYVHLFKGRADFPFQSKSEEYSDQIKSIVENTIKKCPRSMFIFDEVDKMPHGIFEALTSLVDYHFTSNRPDFRQAIFIFISNTAGVDIALHLGDLLSTMPREKTKLGDFEKILEKGAYNLEGGMKKTSLIEAHVIDHYIPFLPLEREHLVQCIKAEFGRWGTKPSSEIIDNIIDETVIFEKKTGLFATSGCKKLDKKVAVAVKRTY